MFKAFILITLLGFSIVSARPKQMKTSDIADWEGKCTLTLGVTSLEMIQLFEKLKADELDGVEERFMCYAECFLENLEQRDDRGRIDFVAIAMETAPEQLPIAEDCVAKYDLEQGKCARSFKINACMALRVEEERKKNTPKCEG